MDYQNNAYIKGDIALLWAKTINNPIKSKDIIIGSNHQAFLALRNSQISITSHLLFAIVF